MTGKIAGLATGAILELLFDGKKALRADYVLDFAGILVRHLGRDTQMNQPLGENGMTLIYFFSNGHAFLQKGNIAAFIHVDHSALAQILHGNADTGLGDPHFLHDINGTDLTVSFLKD